MHKSSASRATLSDRRLFAVVAGRFKPECEIGQGAVCYVQLATDLKTGNHVALKRLKDEMLGRERPLAALANEAAALARVNHPGIPALIAASLEGPEPYLAEEYAAGLQFSLNGFLARPKSALIETFISICDALSSLHKAGMVHRDMKPSNLVLWKAQNAASIVDFGLALVPGMPDMAQGTDIPVGTPMYMAPEQTYRGAKVGRKADIYSVGVMLYSFASGHYPYLISDDSAEGMMALHRTAHAPMMHERSPWIPPRLSFVAAHALEKDPMRRFHDAQEMADALSGCLGC